MATLEFFSKNQKILILSFLMSLWLNFAEKCNFKLGMGPLNLKCRKRRTMIEWLYLILCPYIFCHSWIAFEGEKKGNNKKKMQLAMTNSCGMLEWMIINNRDGLKSCKWRGCKVLDQCRAKHLRGQQRKGKRYWGNSNSLEALWTSWN